MDISPSPIYVHRNYTDKTLFESSSADCADTKTIYRSHVGSALIKLTLRSCATSER